MIKRLASIGALFILIISLAACTHNTYSQATADVGFANVANSALITSNISKLRLQALQETATTLGARGALAWRGAHIDTALNKETDLLNRIFDFNQLLLPHNVLPPILVEVDKSLRLDNSDTIRMADKTYRIIAPARFVTSPPNWHDYIWLHFKKPDIPSNSLLPHNKTEAAIWNHYLKIGWKQGLQQANEIFAVDLNRLKRDYLGMVLYRKLVANKMISSPVVAKADLGITGNHKMLRIHDQIMRITAHSALQLNSRRWQPIITH